MYLQIAWRLEKQKEQREDKKEYEKKNLLCNEFHGCHLAGRCKL